MARPCSRPLAIAAGRKPQRCDRPMAAPLDSEENVLRPFRQVFRQAACNHQIIAECDGELADCWPSSDGIGACQNSDSSPMQS